MALADTADVSAKRIKPTRSPNVSGAVGDIVLPECCERGSQSVRRGPFGPLRQMDMSNTPL